MFFLFLMLLFCDSAAAYQPRNNYGARLEPIGKVLHGAGQDLDGFSGYTNVMDANEHPTVFMAYYNIWDRFAGSLRTQLDSFREFNDSYLSAQIGLYLVDSYQQIAAGGLDEQVETWCRELEKLGHPVYLRIGYEANGSWNGYEPNAYKSAFIRITNIIRNLHLNNVATVWCIVPDSASQYMPYYPGDEYVDWWSIDLFNASQINSSDTSAILDNAHSHGKPVMIGESSPADFQTTGGWTSWNGWFVPYFNLINNRPGIKAFCYINWNWPVKMPELAAWGDCRLESNAIVAQNYRDQMSSSLFYHATDEKTFRQQGLGITDINTPAQVTGLTADINSYYPLVLKWDSLLDDTGIARYEVERNGQTEGHSASNEYQDDNTYAGQTYLYKVDAVDNGGNTGQKSRSSMVVLPPAINKTINGQFDKGKQGWKSDVFAAGNTMYFDIDSTSKLSGQNSAKLTITQTTGTNWYMQLRQFFNTRANFKYKVTFRAVSNASRTIQLWLQETDSPYQTFLNNTFSITTTPQIFTTSVGISPDDDYIALAFVLGASGTGTIWIDDVTLTEISNAPDPQSCLQVKSMGYGLGTDLSGDCHINFADFQLFANQWLNTNCGSSNNCSGADFQPDASVDMEDLSILCLDWLLCNNPQDQSCLPTW